MDHPGRLYVLATLLPLASFLLLLLAGALRAAVRPLRENGLADGIYRMLGGDRPVRVGAFIATGAISLAFVLSLVGFVWFLQDHEISAGHDAASQVAGGHRPETEGAQGKADRSDGTRDWSDEFITWIALEQDTKPGTVHFKPATVLSLGYHIDSLTALMFLMVTLVAALIHIFSIGYMSEELHPVVEDHQVHTEEGHLHRHGRFGRFFLFLSLFCFSMLNLVLADNLFQVFLSWELVGICSYLLIGFYYERQSASNAANKAFIVNRVGDAGFIIGLLIVWTYIGTFNFEGLFAGIPHLQAVELFPGFWVAPRWILFAAGLGVFLGCVGKSAQFPLHVWLPDAMEGPTPVSALIHAATMVAAGVYLVGRVYPLFTEDVRLVIAYTGGITLFLAATIALVMTDIKKVLAYSTVSQLGYMMLALGIGGWVAGLFHLLTHAFFKALLFLCSGSVIYGCHHEQEMTRMGGLFPKMKITAITMLIGVLTIAGLPLFSGWYSKDAIMAQALGFWRVHPEHWLLFALPLVTAGITAFYMFRMWFMTFTGEPRDHHVYEHAHESPGWMTVPLVVLAACSVLVASGLPPWQAENSYLGGHEGLLQMSEPQESLRALKLLGPVYLEERASAAQHHFTAEMLALGVGASGFVLAALFYLLRVLNPATVKGWFGPVYEFLWRKWYFDELYDVLLVQPALGVARWCRSFDTEFIDGLVDDLARATVSVAKWDGRFDLGVIDGAANLIARVAYAFGGWFRTVQTGYIRSYVLFLVLGALSVFFALTYFVLAG
jgi:NADH-quinone oxidoreductase subunit L